MPWYPLRSGYSHCPVYVLGGVLQIEKLARIPKDLAALKYYIWVPRAVQVNLVTVPNFGYLVLTVYVQGAVGAVSLIHIVFGVRLFKTLNRTRASATLGFPPFPGTILIDASPS